MTENQNDIKKEDLGENHLGITNRYNENERPKNKSDSILNIIVKKLKSRTKAFVKKVKDNDKDIETEFDKKSKEI
ncbi:MAG TPA: hypothetical protein VD815_05365 [Candidatus Saccharimonadales bacterium]|nr:hypothetical protein [Candidatus Saccharimonadales bacterium]